MLTYQLTYRCEGLCLLVHDHASTAVLTPYALRQRQLVISDWSLLMDAAVVDTAPPPARAPAPAQRPCPCRR